MSSVETAALERLITRDARVATEEILSQVMLETEATNAVLYHDRGELRLKGGVGVDQDCLDRVQATWTAGAQQLREGQPRWGGSWCLWPCPTPGGLALVYLAGPSLRQEKVRVTVGGIARLLGILTGAELLKPLDDEAARSAEVAVDVFLRNATAEEVERRQLTLLLHENEWNIAAAARRRGVTRVTVYKWMRRLGVARLKMRRGLRVARMEPAGTGGSE